MAYMNFPEVWSSTVVEMITSASIAPWLDNIQEFDSPIIEMASGEIGEKNVIHIPIANLDPKVLINNSTYPLAVEEYTDDGTTVSLDKYQTRATSVPDDAIIGASYDRIAVTAGSHIRNIQVEKYRKAIHSIAPDTDSSNTPILIATGAPDPTGRPTLIYADLVRCKKALDDQDTPEDNRRLVLTSDHWNDLLIDRDRFGNILIDYQAGKPAPKIAGFDIYQYIGNPYFDPNTKAKLPFGSVPGTDARKGSVFFYTPNVGKKTGITKQYYLPSELNPTEQSNKLNYRHYFIATKIKKQYLGAIV